MGLYDEWIKVSMVKYEETDYIYPKMTCQGGPIAAYFQNYFYKKPAICYNKKLENDIEMVNK